MSVHYLLDGYNILHKLAALTLETLDDERRSLIHLIEISCPQGSSRNEVTIVFDGSSGFWGRIESATIKVIFSIHESADEKILSMVEDSSLPKNFIVVTDDRQIQKSVKVLGAKILAVDEFLGRLKLPHAKTKAVKKVINRRLENSERKISDQAQFIINRELEDLWIQKRNKKAKEA